MVGLADIAGFHHAADTDETNHRPAIENGHALNGKTGAVQHGGIVLLAAGDQGVLLAVNLFFADDKGEHLVNGSLELGGDSLPFISSAYGGADINVSSMYQCYT